MAEYQEINAVTPILLSGFGTFSHNVSSVVISSIYKRTRHKKFFLPCNDVENLGNSKKPPILGEKRHSCSQTYCSHYGPCQAIFKCYSS